jgi:uncharacterized glyoxalase superfamily protein PhnB
MAAARARDPIVPLLWCDKPRDAIAWLEKAFGFEAQMVVGGQGEEVIHSELTLPGGGAIYVVGPSGIHHAGASPRDVGGRNTQTICVNLTAGIDEHFARARAAGAGIEREPADQPYGDRVYTCTDPEGHHWSFCQPVTVMSAAEIAEATGRKIETPAGANG